MIKKMKDILKELNSLISPEEKAQGVELEEKIKKVNEPT